MSDLILITFEEMQSIFYKLLVKNGFSSAKANTLASVFAENSLDGIYTHGVNRFTRFINDVQNKHVINDSEPFLKSTFGSVEQWDGNSAAGPLNALFATERSMQLSQQNGIGCVALANTNHWMRGGTYGWQAAKAGCVFMGWTNTTALMPAWGAIDAKLGNNPLVFAVPYKNEAIVLDMAMSQYSFGAMELAKLKGEELSVFGGYDEDGNLSKNPEAILKSKRSLPIGYWKGAGLSLLLDILAAILSAGSSVNDIRQRKPEHGLSQVFITIDISKLNNYSTLPMLIENIINDYHSSIPQSSGQKITYPGERVLQHRNENLKKGIPVIKKIWEEILSL